MQNDIKYRKKKVAIICAAVMISLMVILLAIILFPLFAELANELLPAMVLLIYGIFILAVIAGILSALRQRLKEIEGGEEDEARKY